VPGSQTLSQFPTLKCGPATSIWRQDGGRNDGEAVACDENGLAVTQFGGPPVLGSNEQIFGVNEQILGRDQSD